MRLLKSFKRLGKNYELLSSIPHWFSFIGGMVVSNLTLPFNLRKKYDEETSNNLMKIAATFQITAKGQPVIYYGEEIVLTGENNYPYQTNRYDFDWSLVSDSNSMYMHYRKLLNIREDYSKVFAKGTRNVCVSDDTEGYEVIAREYNGEKLFVGFNIKDNNRNVSVNTGYAKGTKLYDIYNGITYIVNESGIVEISLPSVNNGGTVILSTEDKDGICGETSEIVDNTLDGADKNKTDKADDLLPNQAVNTGDNNSNILLISMMLISAVVVLSANIKKKTKFYN